MQVTDIDAQGLKHEFKVVVPAGQIEERLQTKLAEISKTVRIAGFRPGKVPLKLVRQKYGASVFGEIIESVVNDGTHKVVTDKGLRPAISPKVEITSFAEGGDLEFKVAVEIMPDIVPMDFSGIAIEKETAVVPDSELDKALESIAKNQEGSEKVDRAAKSGDITVIDFVGKRDGEAFAGGSAENYKLKLGSNSFVPGFEDQLIGAKAGEERVLSITFPENYGNKDLAGVTVTFDVKVNEVHKTVPAKVDDELAKSIGAESLEKLKDYLRDQMSGEITMLARARLKRRLLDILADNHSFPVPDSLVDHEFGTIWKQVETDKSNGELDPEDAGKSEDQLKSEFRSLSERRVRLGLLLAEVGRVNSITVTQDDLNQGLMAEASRYPGQEQMVFQYYQKNPEALDQIWAPIFEDKVIDFILELAKVTIKEVTAEELRKSQETDNQAKEAETAEVKPKKRTAKKKAAEAESEK